MPLDIRYVVRRSEIWNFIRKHAGQAREQRAYRGSRGKKQHNAQ